MFQAVVCVTPSLRPSSIEEMPCLVWVIRYMARNQVVSGTLVDAKMVPAVSEVCRRQPLHWQSSRGPTMQCSQPERFGQTNPRGQRHCASALRQSSSVP